MSQLDYEINKELGECYLFMGDLEKAEDYYSKAAGCMGTEPDPYMGLATIAVQQGDLNKAYTLYSKAASIKADDKALAGMALVEMETGREPQAFDHFVEALQSNPANMVALYGLIQLGHTQSRLEEVIVHMENFLRLEPEKTEIRYSLAGCLISVGQNERAADELRALLEKDPENVSARELYDQLRSAA
ncbi:MAG: tetratricopeptide repeat protein [Desulfovibrio sp.]|uniref:tetratricopeptide repeat protein n=1 Tax=Desulfovibrio sp. 7SRBS1 TaxID=3378064 RepID=UPI003B4225D8